jgi:formylglycine-generating enzyme required for sulfatase activity
VARLDAYAWYADNANKTLHAVRQKRPNPWGLYDMHGNAWEWVRDAYGDYSKTPQLDPMRGSGEEPYRVVRGGSFVNSPLRLRSAVRASYLPERRGWSFGFRCVRVPARPD